jgi:acyl CoA:acetate/3-ketoacid CoA transferase
MSWDRRRAAARRPARDVEADETVNNVGDGVDEHLHMSVRRKLAVDDYLPLVIVASAIGGPIERPTSHV